MLFSLSLLFEGLFSLNFKQKSVRPCKKKDRIGYNSHILARLLLGYQRGLSWSARFDLGRAVSLPVRRQVSRLPAGNPRRLRLRRNPPRSGTAPLHVPALPDRGRPFLVVSVRKPYLCSSRTSLFPPSSAQRSPAQSSPSRISPLRDRPPFPSVP
jgi:hypothetical protein